MFAFDTPIMFGPLTAALAENEWIAPGNAVAHISVNRVSSRGELVVAVFAENEWSPPGRAVAQSSVNRVSSLGDETEAVLAVKLYRFPGVADGDSWVNGASTSRHVAPDSGSNNVNHLAYAVLSVCSYHLALKLTILFAVPDVNDLKYTVSAFRIISSAREICPPAPLLPNFVFDTLWV